MFWDLANVGKAMFAFEFAILLIVSVGTLSRYVISLVEKYILYKEACRRKEARTIERAIARQQREARRTENEQRRAAGEEVEDEEEEEEEDEEEEELDVGGWEEKGTWVFYSELATGTFLRVISRDVFPDLNANTIIRFPQVGFLPYVLWVCLSLLRTTSTYPPGSVPYQPLVYWPHPRLYSVSPCHIAYELALSRCHCRGGGRRRRLHYLPRGDASVVRGRNCWQRSGISGSKAQGKEASLWPCPAFLMSPKLA